MTVYRLTIWIHQNVMEKMSTLCWCFFSYFHRKGEKKFCCKMTWNEIVFRCWGVKTSLKIFTPQKVSNRKGFLKSKPHNGIPNNWIFKPKKKLKVEYNAIFHPKIEVWFTLDTQKKSSSKWIPKLDNTIIIANDPNQKHKRTWSNDLSVLIILFLVRNSHNAVSLHSIERKQHRFIISNGLGYISIFQRFFSSSFFCLWIRKKSKTVTTLFFSTKEGINVYSIKYYLWPLFDRWSTTIRK